MTTTPVDRRRDRAQAAHADAERAQAAVTELQSRLQTNAEVLRGQKQTLRDLEAETKRLRRALKTHVQDRERLEKLHRKAKVKADKAAERADAAEQKYSKSVLADLVRREKERDRAASGGPDEPAAEPATSLAQATAARQTAARAAQAGSSINR